ncbi:hypothetical protein [Candidatus Foliamicus sp.]
MRDPEADSSIDRELAVLFANADAPPETDAEFVARVVRQIRRHERTRWWILGSATLIACIFGVPAAWDLLAAWHGTIVNVLDSLSGGLDQAISPATDLLGRAVRSVTFLVTAALAIAIVPLLRWLAD